MVVSGWVQFCGSTPEPHFLCVPGGRHDSSSSPPMLWGGPPGPCPLSCILVAWARTISAPKWAAGRETNLEVPTPILQGLSWLEQMGFPVKAPSKRVSHTCEQLGAAQSLFNKALTLFSESIHLPKWRTVFRSRINQAHWFGGQGKYQ